MPDIEKLNLIIYIYIIHNEIEDLQMKTQIIIQFNIMNTKTAAKLYIPAPKSLISIM